MKPLPFRTQLKILLLMLIGYIAIKVHQIDRYNRCADLSIIRLDDDDADHFCGDCGHKLTIVRPGKYQCDNPKCPSNYDDDAPSAPRSWNPDYPDEGWPV